jgi:hypothetical protein
VKSNRAILWVDRTYASARSGKTVGDFLHYIHYRDSIQQGQVGDGLPGLVRYVAHRDQASPEGRLFTRNRNVGDLERRALARFVGRSLEAVPTAVLGRKWGRVPAAYRFVISPEDARGLDLRRLTRETMRQLEQDAGDLPPWIAAEHRNTAHAHIHIVMSARREVAPGQFRAIVVTRERLARMRATMRGEIELQRGARQLETVLRSRSEAGERGVGERARHRSRPAELLNSRWQLSRSDPFRGLRRRARPQRSRGLSWYPIPAAFDRLAAHSRREMEREEREAMRSGRPSGRDASDEREREVYE